MTKFPCVPGHELAGVVSAVGKNVTKYKVSRIVRRLNDSCQDQVGDHVGVGCIVDSCMGCSGCEAGEEHLCAQGMTMTYNDETKHGHLATDSGWTYGGYSGSHTVNQK